MTQMDRDADYIKGLEELRIILTDLFDKEKELKELLELLKLLKDSKVERYSWFASHSTFGKDCSYAKRAKEIFNQLEQKRITDKIVDIYNKFIRDQS